MSKKQKKTWRVGVVQHMEGIALVEATTAEEATDLIECGQYDTFIEDIGYTEPVSKAVEVAE